MMRTIFSAVMLLTSWSVISTSATKTGAIIRVFNHAETEKFNHLTVDFNTGKIFIGAVNNLLQLSPDLDFEIAVKTGPENDHHDCSALMVCSADAHLTSKDNVNKVLVIDYTTSRLISCGTLHQGICSVHHLSNISRDIQVVKEAVVANTAEASTVAFIAPGPPDPDQTQVMYVGVTYTGNFPHRSEIPAVSSRSLDPANMLTIADMAVTSGTMQFFNTLARERYPVHYIYGFSSKQFSYFMTVQMKSILPSPFISKLVRVCQYDQHYNSYTEIPIECEQDRKYNVLQAAYLGKPGSSLASDLGITVQDDVLFAVFSESVSQDTFMPLNNSALCVYSLKTIRRMFLRNIELCFAGIGARGLDFIFPSQPCVKSQFQSIGEDFCGLDLNTHLGGDLAVSAKPVAIFNKHLTAVTATSTGEHTIVFLGTSTGHLKKVVVESATAAHEYGEVVIDKGSPINPDLHFDMKLMHLYIMTEKKLTKIKVQDCANFKTCHQCLNVKDPYCGWCSLKNQCSQFSDCNKETSNSSEYWISYKTGHCPSINSVSPENLPITQANTWVQLYIDHMPRIVSRDLHCSFSVLNKSLMTTAFRKTYGVNCTSPGTELIRAWPSGQHSLTVKLSVRLNDGQDIVATNFTFSECSAYKSCTDCVSAQYPCSWCLDGHRCTLNTTKDCRNDILIAGVNFTEPSYRKGPSFCPSLQAFASGPEILVAADTKKRITVKLQTIGQFFEQIARFYCQFNIEGHVSSVNAALLADTIHCKSMEFSYTSRAPKVTATFSVTWSETKALDNPENVHVVIYRCRNMADNCGMCHILDEKFGCGWCASSSSCEVQEQCGAGTPGGWLDRNKTCPNIKIIKFQPMLGPWEGGTNITITGVNLGKSFNDTYGAVMVAGITCLPYKDLYVRTQQIVCAVDGTGRNLPRSGPVLFDFQGLRAESAKHFQFEDPVIESISPKQGPLSGGTILTIKGKYMNAGSNIQAFIDDLPCKIIDTSPDENKCVTSSADRLRHGEIKMTFDRGVRYFVREQFEYVEDPTVETVKTGTSGYRNFPKGFPAGGSKMYVTGNNLANIADPQIYVYYNNEMFKGPCTVQSNSEMTCDSPTVVLREGHTLDADSPLQLEFGFIMDHVSSVRNLSRLNFTKFSLFPDPVYEPFDGEIKYLSSDYLASYLVINGQHLDLACEESDVVVKIGDEYCEVATLSRHQLTCRPPKSQPTAVQAQGQATNQDVLEVVVSVGRNRTYRIGKLRYLNP